MREEIRADAPPRGRRAAAAALRLTLLALLLQGLPGCRAEAGEKSLVVTATAYNSLRHQTNEEPSVAAWGDRLEPGMKAIAVSRDLLDLGLRRGTRVRIEGLPGEYVVLDKMHRRWKKKIDVYMGKDVEAARRFGRRKLRITWTAPDHIAVAGREPPEHLRVDHETLAAGEAPADPPAEAGQAR